MKGTGQKSQQPAAVPRSSPAKTSSAKPPPKKVEQEYFDEDEYSDEAPPPTKQNGKQPAVVIKSKSGEEVKVTSITSAYKSTVPVYVEEDHGSEDEDESGPDTPHKLEKALKRTIQEMATYMASITADLEAREQDEHAKLREARKTVPAPLWADSTFKIDFTKGLLLQVFGHRLDRLMKYYIIFLLPMKKWIKARKEIFFMRAQVFPGAPEEDIKFFRNLWSIQGTLSESEKNTIWEFWDIQIEIVEDWWALTQWEINYEEKLNIPNIDYERAARDAGIVSDDEEDNSQRKTNAPAKAPSKTSVVKKEVQSNRIEYEDPYYDEEEYYSDEVPNASSHATQSSASRKFK
jgi:hypothetical protein